VHNCSLEQKNSYKLKVHYGDFPETSSGHVSRGRIGASPLTWYLRWPPHPSASDSASFSRTILCAL